MIFKRYFRFGFWIRIYVHDLAGNFSACNFFDHQCRPFQHVHCVGNIHAFFKTGSRIGAQFMPHRSFADAHRVKPGAFQEDIFCSCRSPRFSFRQIHPGDTHAFFFAVADHQVFGTEFSFFFIQRNELCSFRKVGER
jgi:hypothetical protein